MISQSHQVRLDDYATIGAFLGAVLTPAIFLKRARLIHSALGGVGLGVAGGSITHYWKTFQSLDSGVSGYPISPPQGSK